MAWSGITSAQLYSAGNAIPVTNIGDELISVTVKRPASGEDVIVTFYADGAPIHTMTTSATDPIKTSSFSAPGATALNYSTDRAFASPGASISASTEASTPTSTPSGDVAVAGAIHAPVGNRGIVIIGSSSGAYSPNPGTLQASTNGNYSAGTVYGPMTWAIARARPDLPVLANYAVGSTLLADQEAQMVQARPVMPSHMFFFCGSNDAYNNVPASTIWATLRGWAEECLQWGGSPILVAPFARVTTSATQAAILTKLRALISDWCARQNGTAFLVDALGVVAQPGSATLAPKTDYISTAGGTPNIHLSNLGASEVGGEIATLLGRIVPKKMEIAPLPGYETDATGLELLQNPQFLGTDGSLPTNWTNTISGSGATCTYSNVAKSKCHNAIRITFNANGPGNYIQFTQSSVSGRIPAGSWATSGIKVKLVSGGEYLRNCALAVPLKTGDALTASVMAQDGTEANRKPFTNLNGEEWWIELGRFLKDDTTGGRFQLTCTANGVGAIVLELEAPYCQLSEDGWPR